MKERGKALDAYSCNNYVDFNYTSADMPCKKHPSSSSVGICPDCLKERLNNLVCSEYGERRLSSCSCSDVSSSSYRNSCTGEFGNVGRISFFIENEKSIDHHDHDHDYAKANKGDDKSEQVILLRRSNSSWVEIKRSKNGFWKIKRLFRKKREKGTSYTKDHRHVVDDDKTNMEGVLRSKALCSFRNDGLINNDADESTPDCTFSSAKISDATDSNNPYGINEFGPRKSGFRGLLDSGDQSGVNSFKSIKKLGGAAMELNRANSVTNWSVFPVKESDFSAMDESAFIDLKLDFSLESKRVFSASDDHGDGSLRRSEVYESGFVSLKNVKNSGGFSSCRIPLIEKEVKSGRKAHKVWKWIFRQNSSRRSTK